MAEVTRFPSSQFCDDCGKPLIEGEGSLCSYPGCHIVGCQYCTEQSDRCTDHIGCELLKKCDGS